MMWVTQQNTANSLHICLHRHTKTVWPITFTLEVSLSSTQSSCAVSTQLLPRRHTCLHVASAGGNGRTVSTLAVTWVTERVSCRGVGDSAYVSVYTHKPCQTFESFYFAKQRKNCASISWGNKWRFSFNQTSDAVAALLILSGLHTNC